MNKNLKVGTDNFLFSSNCSEINEFLKFSIQLAKQSKISLFISTHQENVNLLSLVDYYDKSVLKNILFMYFPNIEDVVNKLLELHSWSFSPSLILVDLDGFFRNTCIYPFKQKICSLIASLFSYVESLENKNLASGAQPIFRSNAVVILNKLENDCSHKSIVIQLLIDLYFYNSAFSNFQMLCEKLVNIV